MIFKVNKIRKNIIDMAFNIFNKRNIGNGVVELVKIYVGKNMEGTKKNRLTMNYNA